MLRERDHGDRETAVLVSAMLAIAMIDRDGILCYQITNGIRVRSSACNDGAMVSLLQENDTFRVVTVAC